jgi:hypothetical protein
MNKTTVKQNKKKCVQEIYSQRYKREIRPYRFQNLPVPGTVCTVLMRLLIIGFEVYGIPIRTTTVQYYLQ